MKKKEIVLGADPEIFVTHADGTLFPAFEFLPSKYEPVKTEDGNNAYWDGFQAEFNITPSSKIVDCLRSIRFGLKSVLNAAQKKDPTSNLSTKTVVDVPLATLKELPIEFTEFGCMPSYNVYEICGMGGEGHTVPYRFAGGHIHFGTGHMPEELTINIVKSLDAVLGIACVSMFENFDNPVRRRYYGLAGEHRLPPHGLEYRSLSDAWLFHPEVASMILDLARRVVDMTLAGKSHKWKTDDSEVIETILLSDVKKAREILDRNSHLFGDMGFKTKFDLKAPIEKSVPEFANISGNWNLAS